MDDRRERKAGALRRIRNLPIEERREVREYIDSELK